MTIAVVKLKPKEDKRILSGHLWVFSNEIAGIDGKPDIGDVVEVKSKNSEQLGFGFYNPATLIAVRMFSKRFIEPDKNFFINRIQTADSLRQQFFNVPFYRLTHGESDFLPGLIIDRFDKLFSVQMFSAAMEKRKDIIYNSIMELFSPKAIYERNESASRQLEGLPQTKSIICGDEQVVDYDESGALFRINPFSGQKTGFYFDQRLNRMFSRQFAEHARVLDLFSNEGGFAINMAHAGAEEVIAVDSSELAIKNLTTNSDLNQLKNVHGKTADAFDFLDKGLSSEENFDVVVCDPPSFTKNRKSVTTAKAGYRRLHESLLKLLKPEGILLTASCSHHIFRETFEGIVSAAAIKSGRTLQLLHRAGASPDHPVLPVMPETEYL
ncbi:MAG: class I SAM-dependent rRNA methyltransferase, partial [Candidatus Kryptoniota bacterium]